MRDERVFEQCVGWESSLPDIRLLCPVYPPALNKPTRREVIGEISRNKIRNRGEVIKNARMVYQSLTTNTGFFWMLPYELNRKIVAFTNDESALEGKEAGALVDKNFNRPAPKPNPFVIRRPPP